jgi:CRISPR-associated endonuclease Csn1
MNYRLALDVGANSIGWCALDLGADGAPRGIIGTGVRVFPDGRDPKTLSSLAAERRLARSMRRRRDRYLQRRRALMNALIRYGLMPADEGERKLQASLDPYVLREAALHRQLAPTELGRVVFHLNQRRGFQSNRKMDRANEEQGKIANAADRLKTEIARGGHATLGAWLAERHARRAEVRARLRGSGAKAEYPFYPTRDLIAEEFDAIWTAQSAWNPALTAVGREHLRRIILFQRPLKDPAVGRCGLEPDELRAPRALPSTQAFRISQDLANLAIRRAGEPDARLTAAQRNTLYELLLSGKDLSFDRMRRLLKLGDDASFNLEGPARDGIAGDQSAARLAGKNRPLASIWPELSLFERDAIVQALLDADISETAIDALIALGLPAEAAAASERVTLPDGHGSLSSKAVHAILPHLEAGLRYSDAVLAAGYPHHSDDRDGVIHERLPYYGEVLAERLGTGTGRPGDGPERFWGRVANPTVHVALNQLRRIVNAVIERHGPPTEIVVEVLRELGRSAAERRSVEKEQAENRRRREGWARKLQELGVPANGRNLAFMRLWEEQAKDPKDRVCPYTGERISVERLLSGEVEEDHILPFALTLDDSFANRVLVMREANRRKARQTPHDAFGSSSEWPDISARARLLPSAKAWRFAPDALDKWRGEHKDFLARHLTDSAYLARLSRLYLRAVCDPVWLVPGKLTALVRDKLGLNASTVLGKGGVRKDRTDHRHHAVDALVVGLCDRGLLQRVATAARRAEERGRRLLDDLPEPWPGFVAEASQKIRAIVVSHKQDTAPQGRLHNDTAYAEIPSSGPRLANVAHRVPVASLTGWTPEKTAAAIADPRLRAHIDAALAAGDKTKQAAALAVIPHDAAGTVVRRVQVAERLDGTAAIADRRTGRPYKRVKLDANHRAEFWKLPSRGPKAGEVAMLVVPMLEAARAAEARRLGRQTPDTRPHPAARLLMTLHKDDIVAFGLGAERRFLRVVKFRDGQVNLAEVHEGGSLKARDADKSDTFKYVNASVSRLRTEHARKIFVDAAGRVRDLGSLNW